MKCKFCEKEMKATLDSMARCYCNDNIDYWIDSDGKQSLELRNEEVDNFITTRKEHIEQKAKIEELKKENYDLEVGSAYEISKLKLEILSCCADRDNDIIVYEERIADLTPPIKAGDFFWGVYNNVQFEYTCDHCYKVDDKWIAVWLDSNFDEHKLIWGETAFATEAEAEKLNRGNK